MLNLYGVVISALVASTAYADTGSSLNASSIVGHGKDTLYCARDLAVQIIQASPASKHKDVHVQIFTTKYSHDRIDKRATGPANVIVKGSIGGVPFEGDMTLTYYNEFDSDHKIKSSKCHVETGRLPTEHVFEIKDLVKKDVLVSAEYEKDQCPIRLVGVLDQHAEEIGKIVRKMK